MIFSTNFSIHIFPIEILATREFCMYLYRVVWMYKTRKLIQYFFTSILCFLCSFGFVANATNQIDNTNTNKEIMDWNKNKYVCRRWRQMSEFSTGVNSERFFVAFRFLCWCDSIWFVFFFLSFLCIFSLSGWINERVFQPLLQINSDKIPKNGQTYERLRVFRPFNSIS